jgi:hypothetical protein
METVSFYCRHCNKNTEHAIVSYEHDLPNFNFSFIKCTHGCDTLAFAVQYDKSRTHPLSNSRRVSDILGDSDEQPTDIV